MPSIEADPKQDLSTVERVTLLSFCLADGERLSVYAAARLTGLTVRSARRLLNAMSRKAPIYCDEAQRVWQRCEMREMEV